MAGLRFPRRLTPRQVAALSRVRSVRRQVRAKAVEVRRDAREIAPVRTGRLRRSLAVVNHYDPSTRVVSQRVGWDTSIAWYGWIVELRRPHLRPAAARHGGRLPSE